MSCYQKFMTTFSGKQWALLLTAGCFALSGMTTGQVNFSGEWKLNESKSNIGGKFPLCIFGGDRMRSKTMKIATHAGFLTVDVASSSADGALVTRQEKLVFDGKQNKATYVGMAREKSSASWSGDGQTMTVHSVRSFDKNGETADFKITEVWKLINGGKSIAIQVNERSSSGAHAMTLVYDKQWAADYRF
jgi:hypothetical protein